mmetsp:Transcript_55463/g.152859  ORF Transcript_55463/g.152859 Transcript_55463/m.152859 type:complete len:545 (-) Transcript_55463:408-2042(-)
MLICTLDSDSLAASAIEVLIDILQAWRRGCGSSLADLHAVLILTQTSQLGTVADLRGVVCSLLDDCQESSVSASEQLLGCAATVSVVNCFGAKLCVAAAAFDPWSDATLVKTLLETPVSDVTGDATGGVVDCMAVALSHGGPLDGIDCHDWVVAALQASKGSMPHPAMLNLLDHYVDSILPSREHPGRKCSLPFLPSELRMILSAREGDEVCAGKVMALHVSLQLEDRARSANATLPFRYHDVISELPLRSVIDFLESRRRSKLEEGVLRKLWKYFPDLLTAGSDQPAAARAQSISAESTPMWANDRNWTPLASQQDLEPAAIRILATSTAVPLCEKEKALMRCLPKLVERGGEDGLAALADAVAELWFCVRQQHAAPQQFLLETARSLLYRKSLQLAELFENQFLLLTLPAAALRQPGTLQVALGVLEFCLASSGVSLATATAATSAPLDAAALVILQELIVARCLLGLCRGPSTTSPQLRVVACTWLQQRFRKFPAMPETLLAQGLPHEDAEVREETKKDVRRLVLCAQHYTGPSITPQGAP